MPEAANDIRFGRALAVGGALIALIVVGLVISAGALLIARQYTDDPGRNPAVFTTPGPLPPEPRFQTDPHAELLRMRAAEDSMLTTYGWVDRDSGMARIPVARAMALITERGMPLHGTPQDRKGGAQ